MMPASSLLKSVLAFFLLIDVVFAGRYSFSIQDIIVRKARDDKEDDLFLALASTAGSSTIDKNFTLVAVEAGDTIKWTNLTQEVEVPAAAANLSVAFGLANIANPAENKGIATSLSKYPRSPHVS